MESSAPTDDWLDVLSSPTVLADFVSLLEVRISIEVQMKAIITLENHAGLALEQGGDPYIF